MKTSILDSQETTAPFMQKYASANSIFKKVQKPGTRYLYRQKSKYQSSITKSQSKKTINENDLNNCPSSNTVKLFHAFNRGRNSETMLLQKNLSKEKNKNMDRNFIDTKRLVPCGITSRASHQSLQQVIQDLELQNNEIIQQAKTTVEDFQNYIEQLLKVNFGLEERIAQYEETFHLFQLQKNQLEQELCQLRRNKQKAIDPIFAKDLETKLNQMAERSKKQNIVQQKLKKQIADSAEELKQKQQRISQLQQGITDKEMIIKKMSMFNNDLCLEIVELKSQKHQSEQKSNLIQLQIQINVLKEANRSFRLSVLEFLKDGEAAFHNLMQSLHKQKEKNNLLEKQLTKEIQKGKNSPNHSQNSTFSFERTKLTGKICKQATPKSSEPKINFFRSERSSQNGNETYSEKSFQEYILKSVHSPRQFFAAIGRIIEIFCQKIKETQQNLEIGLQIQKIEESLSSLTQQNKKYPVSTVIEKHFQDKKVQSLEQKINKMKMFRKTIEQAGCLQKLEYKKKKAEDVTIKQIFQLQSEEKSDQYYQYCMQDNIQKFGDFESYADFTFEPKKV